MREDISNNRAGLWYSVGAFFSGFLSSICFFLLPLPINLIFGAILGVASIVLGITALYKNNRQAKELQQALLNTNKKVNNLTPVIVNTIPQPISHIQYNHELENYNNKNIPNNEYLYNNKQIDANNSVINIPTIQSEQTKQRK